MENYSNRQALLKFYKGSFDYLAESHGEIK